MRQEMPQESHQSLERVTQPMELKVGGIGVELIKPNRGGDGGKKFDFRNLWPDNPLPGRLTLVIFFFTLGSGGVAFGYGYNSQGLGNELLFAINPYRVYANYFITGFDSLFVFNDITTAQLVSDSTFWGSLINGLVLVFVTLPLLIMGLGRRSKKALNSYLLMNFLNAFGYGVMGITSITIGYYLRQDRQPFIDGCGRLPSSFAYVQCRNGIISFFEDVESAGYGSGIPMLTCSFFLLVCLGLIGYIRWLLRKTEIPSPPQELVTDITFVRQEGIPPRYEPADVSALTRMNQTNVSQLQAMAAEMDRIGQAQFAQQYRIAAQQYQQASV